MSPKQTHPKMNVESFNLDHRYVSAPYVRVADKKQLPGGDDLTKYDIRFTAEPGKLADAHRSLG